jgi:hypothetical protein
MVTLAVDEKLRVKMGQNGAQIVLESYQDTMMIDKYRNVYDQAYNTQKLAKHSKDPEKEEKRMRKQKKNEKANTLSS